MNESYFVEVDSSCKCKNGQHCSGDVFLSRKIDGGNRVISVLADGLGSGVEANVLASLTATMALEYISGDIETSRASEIIMDALPVCDIRKISYSTFTIADTGIEGVTRIIEHGNPPFLLVRDGKSVQLEGTYVSQERWMGRNTCCYEFQMAPGDRVILLSDGITQSGIGTESMPLGWGLDGVEGFIEELIARNPNISARMLSNVLVEAAMRNDGRLAGDDTTCGVIYLRKPRHLRVLTGPPYAKDRDAEYARMIVNYEGKTVVCGGTTANVVARELGRNISMDLSDIDPEIPTTSTMNGVDLVTEGCITLSKTADILESGKIPNRINGATKLAGLLLESDIIHFVVGTRINEAHQNPNLPVELDIRRNVIKRIVHLLESKYLKSTRIDFI